jgi:hypothetical protein
LTARYAGWVLLNYPVVTSRSRDNAGGYDHLLGNIQAYRHLGFKVLCICRWSPRLVDRLEGALVLNIVPGAAVPAPATSAVAKLRPMPVWRRLAQAARASALALLGAGLQRLLRPQLLHQRANLRLMFAPHVHGVTHLVELNDEYVPPGPCDACLTVAPRPTLAAPQFVWRWPVPEVARFDPARFQQRLASLARPDHSLKVLLFGIGGTTVSQAIRRFIGGHPWFDQAAFELHVYGGDAGAPAVDGVVQHGWCDPALLDTRDFDAAVLYYDPQVYDDDRLRLGSPTKLWKYIDWSLPVFCNRPYVSEHFLVRFDASREVLDDPSQGKRYAAHLQALRRDTLPVTYAEGLAGFLAGLHRVTGTESDATVAVRAQTFTKTQK